VRPRLRTIISAIWKTQRIRYKCRDCQRPRVIYAVRDLQKKFRNYQYVRSSGHDEHNHVGHFFRAQDVRSFHFSGRHIGRVEYLGVHESGADRLTVSGQNDVS